MLPLRFVAEAGLSRREPVNPQSVAAGSDLSECHAARQPGIRRLGYGCVVASVMFSIALRGERGDWEGRAATATNTSGGRLAHAVWPCRLG